MDEQGANEQELRKLLFTPDYQTVTENVFQLSILHTFEWRKSNYFECFEHKFNIILTYVVYVILTV